MDPLTELALAIYHSKGCYALLLGSGISRAAGIPTGWEVIIELAQRLATASGAVDVQDPIQWYEDTFQTPVSYSELVRRVAGSDSEIARHNLIRPIIEQSNQPDDVEGPQLRQPTAAHRAIARLVLRGYVRLILTTNFDRLMETALREVGIEPYVVADEHDIAGMTPLVHGGVVVVKIHGDYLSTMIRNTNAELAAYPPALNSLLDRIFDEFGLVISGWSGESDTALREAISRTPTRRFTSFYTDLGPPKEVLDPILTARAAKQIRVQGADDLFIQLEEIVSSLETINADHPLSAKIASERVKRLLAEQKDYIRLRDLLLKECSRSRELLDNYVSAHEAPKGDFGESLPEHEFTMHYLEQAVNMSKKISVVLHMLANIAYYGSNMHEGLICEALALLSERREDSGGQDTHIWHAGLYPALVALFVVSIPLVLKNRYDLIRCILRDTRAASVTGRMDRPLGEFLTFKDVFSFGDFSREILPSVCIERSVMRVLTSLYLREAEIARAFDLFEAVLGLSRLYVADEHRKGSPTTVDPDLIWHGLYFKGGRTDPLETIRTDLNIHGSNYILLVSGLFGELDRINCLAELLRRLHDWQELYRQSHSPD